MRFPAFCFTIPACLAVLLAPLGAPAQAEEMVSVVVNRAKVFRIEEPAKTIIIGNPMIADVVMNDPTTLVITGKSYGTTNLVILGADGQPIIDEIVTVLQPETGLVTVQRSAQRYSYNCSPTCQPTVNMGDQDDFYKQTSEQAAQLTGQAQQAAAPAPE